MIEFSDAEKLTIRNYDKYAKSWANEHSDPNFWREEMTLFRNLLPQGRVLELGSGGGRDAGVLIRKAYDYVGIDVSRGLLNEAKQKVPEGQFFQTSLYHLSFDKNAFGGFWASAVLLHIPKDNLMNIFRDLRRVTQPAAIGFISIKEGEGETVEEETLINGEKIQRFFAYYSDREFACHLGLNNFYILRKFVKPMGHTVWLTYFVKNLKTYAD